MASLRKTNDRFYIIYRDINGKQKSKAIGRISKKQAERELILFDNKSTFVSMNFYDFCFEYCKWHSLEYPASHDRTLQIIRQHLLPQFEFTQLDQITIENGENFKQKRSLKVSSGTVIKEVKTLKAILNKAVEWGRIEKNPLANLRPPKQLKSEHPPFYTVSQLQDIYDVCNEKDEALWRFMANTGVRRGEIINLQSQDLKKNGIYIISRDGARTKSGKFRVIPWSDGSKQAAEVLLKNSGDYLIDRIQSRSLTKKFSRTLQKASLPGSLHWLRHTFGSHLVMNAVPMRVIQQVMGHSSVTITERYAHLDNKFIDNQLIGLSI